MGGVVHPGQVLEIHMGVNLRGADVGMSEQFLHAPQVAARLEQVGGKGMAEHVRMHVHLDALAPRPGSDPQLHRACSEAAAKAKKEQRCTITVPAQ